MTSRSHTYTRRATTRGGLAALSVHTGVSGILAQTPDRDQDEGREIHNDEASKTARDEEELVPLNETRKDSLNLGRNSGGRTGKERCEATSR